MTPAKAAFCGDCSTRVSPDADRCDRCGQRFTGTRQVQRCPECESLVPTTIPVCARCGTDLPPLEEVPEEEYLRGILTTPPGVGATSDRDTAGTQPALDLEARAGEPGIWKFSESMQRMLQSRRHRLEQMDALVQRARQRIKDLEDATSPVKIREREELKRQVAEILVEREDILRLERAILEMEESYRNIVQMQQTQLQEREESLKGRVETFRRDLEKREAEKAVIAEKAHDLSRREDEFRALLNHLHDRERELDRREERLRDRDVDLEEKSKRIDRELVGAGSAGTPGSGDAPIPVHTDDSAVRDLTLKVTDLEERLEGLQEDRRRLAEQVKAAGDAREEFRGILAVLDDLLGRLPEDEVQRFARSEWFEKYEKLLERHGL